MSRIRGTPLHVLAWVFAGALLTRSASAQPAAQHETVIGTICRIDGRTGAIDLINNVGHVMRVRRVFYSRDVKVISNHKEVGVTALTLGAVCRVNCEMSSAGSAATAVEIVRPAPGRNE
jgi:hypothetical protein